MSYGMGDPPEPPESKYECYFCKRYREDVYISEIKRGGHCTCYDCQERLYQEARDARRRVGSNSY